jgi:uncharacterized iron-regulated membrane protein
MKSFFLPSADSPVLQWLGFILFLLIVCVCLGGLVVWLKTAQHAARRKRKHRHHRPSNPTLAQTGGLPPKRAPDQPPPGP